MIDPPSPPPNKNKNKKNNDDENEDEKDSDDEVENNDKSTTLISQARFQKLQAGVDDLSKRQQSIERRKRWRFQS